MKSWMTCSLGFKFGPMDYDKLFADLIAAGFYWTQDVKLTPGDGSEIERFVAAMGAHEKECLCRTLLVREGDSQRFAGSVLGVAIYAEERAVPEACSLTAAPKGVPAAEADRFFVYARDAEAAKRYFANGVPEKIDTEKP